MPKILSQLIPDPLKSLLQRIWAQAQYFGFTRYCPICRSHLRSFKPFGLVPRTDALCPVCGSLERHRLIWLFFKRETNLFDRSPKKMLHFAPEKEFDAILRKTPALDYLTADLADPRAMVRMDIADIQYPDNSFDVIYCSHVLEHVPDDRKAMRQLNRVLKSTGWAVFVVPIKVEKTIEDPSITDPADRERLFGQHDHLRRYGPDFVGRLVEAGFDVTTFSATDIATAKRITRLALKDDKLFFCKKTTT
jgi:SAM-dependent methyltransferase